MPTILQILPALEVGGVERGTLEVAKALVNDGQKSLVLSAGGRLVTQLENEGTRHIQLPIGKKSPVTFFLINKLVNIIKSNNVDILHVRSRLPAWITYLAWRKLDSSTRPRFLTTVHGPYTVNRYSAIMTRGERVIAISNYIHDYILKNYSSVKEENIKIIYRGVDTLSYSDNFRPSSIWINNWHKNYPHLKDKFVITLPARITRWKGQEDFISIISALVKMNLPVHGIIAGGCHDKKKNFLLELKNRIMQSGLEQFITFIGHRDDLKEIMSISDIVYSLSREPEAFGRTALEALSLGTPVIAYNHGGASEILEEIYPFGLVRPHQINEVIDKTVSLNNSMQYPSSNNPFTLEKMLNQTLDLYKELSG